LGGLPRGVVDPASVGDTASGGTGGGVRVGDRRALRRCGDGVLSSSIRRRWSSIFCCTNVSWLLVSERMFRTCGCVRRSAAAKAAAQVLQQLEEASGLELLRLELCCGWSFRGARCGRQASEGTHPQLELLFRHAARRRPECCHGGRERSLLQRASVP
jgi:hypothetical protein